jgi:hypothetical protein
MRLFGHGRSGGRALRVNRTALLLAIAVVLVVGGAKLAQPLGAARRQQDDLAVLRREKANLEAEQSRLLRYQRELATDRGLERAARREGYLRKGERRLVFTREATPPATRAAGKPPAQNQVGQSKPEGKR